MLYARLTLAAVLFAVASVAGADRAAAQMGDAYVSATGVDNPEGVNGAANEAFVQKSLIDGNKTLALVVDGAANTVVISDSTLSGSGQLDLSLPNGGKAISTGRT